MTTKPLRLSPAQWALLRKLPDEGTGAGYPYRNREIPSVKALRRRGLLSESSPRWAWRTPAGRLAVEAEDRRIADEKEAQDDDYCARYLP